MQKFKNCCILRLESKKGGIFKMLFKKFWLKLLMSFPLPGYFMLDHFAAKDLEEAVKRAEKFTGDGHKVTLAYLGKEKPRDCRNISNFTVFWKELKELKVSVDMALKLSMLGAFWRSDIGRGPTWNANSFFTLKHFFPKVPKNVFVWVDAEELKFRERTWEEFAWVWDNGKRKNIGIAVQAYAKDSYEFLRDKIIPLGVPVRLCKGAYNESENLVYKDKQKIRVQFLYLLEKLLQSSCDKIQIATHDDFVIETSLNILEKRNLSFQGEVEFGFLMGRNINNLVALIKETGNYPINIYIPFGPYRKDYGARRIIEDPNNLLIGFGALFKHHKYMPFGM